MFSFQVLAKLPEVFHLDLGDDDILKCIEKVKELDMLNPDVDKFVDALVDLCIGVQVDNYVATMKNTHNCLVSFFAVSTSGIVKRFALVK